MNNIEIVESTELMKLNELGWTYLLVSFDRKLMKVGHTFQPIENRLKKIRNEMGYKGLGLEFLFAIEDAQHERALQDFFQEYSACYNWIDGEDSKKNLTYSEVNSIAFRKAKAAPCNYAKDKLISKHVQVTRFELFKIPPRKVGLNLKELVLKALRSNET